MRFRGFLIFCLKEKLKLFYIVLYSKDVEPTVEPLRKNSDLYLSSAVFL